MNKHDSFKV